MNMSLFFIEGKPSLVTYYLLPLLNINRLTFGTKFENSFINKDATKVYIKLKSRMATPLYKSSSYFITELEINNDLFLMFTIPSEFIVEFKLFLLGKYSEFSKQAKKKIYTSSTLPYNKTVEDFKLTHPILHALGKTKTLKIFLEEYFGIYKLDINEYIDKPKKEWFIENLIKTHNA